MQYRYFSEGQFKVDPTTGTKCRTGQLNHQFVEQKFVGGVWVGIGDNDGVRYGDVAGAGCRFREGMLNGDYTVDVETEIAGFLLAEDDGWVNCGSVSGWMSQFKSLFTGIPIPYSNNPLGDYKNGAFRSCVLVNGMYHLFEERTQTFPSWKIHKRTSIDGLHFSNGSTNPLLLPGVSGEFDEFGQADPTVIYDGIGDWKMWYDAWSGAGKWTLGYATSTDGTTWAKYGKILDKGTSGQWDDNQIHHPCCIKYNGVYYLFYSGSKSTDGGRVVKHIGLATSSNGINWTKDVMNPVILSGTGVEWDNDYIRPSGPVLIFGTWYMWYWGFDGTNHRMGLATSSDLIHWAKQGMVLQDLTNNITASSMMKIQGSNYKDILIKTWFTNFPLYNVNYANITLPTILTKIGKFTTDASKAAGNITTGTPASARNRDRINLHRITVPAGGITPDGIKIFIGEKEGYINPVTFMYETDDQYIKLAIYTNVSNTAQDLIASTDEVDFATVFENEWNTFKFSTPPVLAVGDYWIAISSNFKYYMRLDAGGTNNHGGDALVYTGTFPNPISIGTNYGYSGTDIYLIDTRDNIYKVALTPAPTNVYFNTVLGSKKMVITDVNSEYAWFWAAGTLYIYSTENPDVRYQITYD